MEEENNEGVNEEFDEDLKKLFESLSRINLEHGKTLNDCYAEYFGQKTNAFEQVEKHMGSFIQSFTEDANDFSEIKLSAEVTKEREELLFNQIENFDYVRTDGFGFDRDYKSDNPTTSQVYLKPTTSSDNFCDFVLKESCGKYRQK